MSTRDRRRIRPLKNGTFAVRLGADERALIEALPGQLDAILAEMSTDRTEVQATIRRLFPHAYPTDEAAETAYISLVRDDLLAHHRHALGVLIQTADSTRLAGDELEGWSIAINDLRLVLGSLLDITEDPEELDPDDDRYSEWICYQFLSFLQGEVIEALTDVLPASAADADEQLPEDPWGDPPGGLRWDGTPLRDEPRD